MNSLGLRIATLCDVNVISKIHKESLPEGIFSQIGIDYLRFYYEKSISSLNIILVIEDEIEIYGFLELRKINNKPPLNVLACINLLFLLIIKPYYCWLLYKRIFDNYNPHFSSMEISNFCIKISERSNGFGTRLLKQAFSYAMLNKYNLFTYTHNLNLLNFYIKNYKLKIVKVDNLIIYNSYLIEFK